MKRVVMIAVIMAIITSLFAFTVYAAPSPGTSYTTSISSADNNITAYAYAVYEEGVYQLSSQGIEITSPSLLISIRVVNNTDKWVVKDTDQFKFRINGIYAINYPFEFVDIENCTISEVATASGRADLTIKGDNSFILAPNETYVITFRFVVYDGFTTPSIQFFNNQFANSAYTVDELVTLPADELAYLGSINEGIAQVIAGMSYTGSGYTIDTQNYLNKLYSFNPVAGTVSSISVNVRRYVYPVILNNVDFELDPGDDELLSTQSYIYKVAVYIYVNNYSGKAVKINRLSTISNFVPEGAAAEITSYHSQFFNTYALNQRNLMLGTTYRLDNNTSAGILPSGRDYTFIQYTVYSPTKITTWPDYTFNIFNDTDEFATDWYPESQESLFYKIYKALVKNADEDNTQEAADMNDDIHEAEQVWYDNNTEALEEVGLSNYRFSQSQSSGITQAVTQFQAVWNALGQWTNVYIFILILSISTYIIRHEPTTRVKQYRSSVQAERAERISYYGRKNAESRASASSGSTLKNAIRRRK